MRHTKIILLPLTFIALILLGAGCAKEAPDQAAAPQQQAPIVVEEEEIALPPEPEAEPTPEPEPAPAPAPVAKLAPKPQTEPEPKPAPAPVEPAGPRASINNINARFVFPKQQFSVGEEIIGQFIIENSGPSLKASVNTVVSINLDSGLTAGSSKIKKLTVNERATIDVKVDNRGAGEYVFDYIVEEQKNYRNKKTFTHTITVGNPIP